MNITRDIVIDLFPLYAANECSPDSRKLVEEYLSANPTEAEQLRRIASATVSAPLPAAQLEESASFREARRRVRLRAWAMALAIFFSLAPFSFGVVHGQSWWMVRDQPKAALAYAAIGAIFWVIYARQRRGEQSL